MKKRLQNISKALINYSVGNFRTKLRVSSQLDEVDAVIAGINMLGEELRETTISKNFFNNIFDSVSEMMFVVNFKGAILNANKPALENLAPHGKNDFEKLPIDELVSDKQLSIARQIKKLCDKQLENIIVETDFTGLDRTRKIPARCVITPMESAGPTRRFLVTLHDLTAIRAYEQSLKKSEEKYRKIFEDSSDCIFICDPEGFITEINTAGRRLLLPGTILEDPLNIFNLVVSQNERKKLVNRLKKQGNVENTYLKITSADGSIAECLLSANVFFDTNNTVEGYRGIIKNITLQKETEKLIIRTIVDTQEKERIRFAKDIHDSLGQQLSAIKFYIGTSVDTIKDKKQKEILQKSNTALITMLADMRSICFNLMPKTLENFGLVQAIRELCNYPGLKEQMHFNITATEVFPVLNKNMEIGIFRIVQEFINNAQKHGKASKVDILLKSNGSNQIKIILQDNGKGFDTTKTNSFSGMGLKNVQSRVSSYNGDVVISSMPNKGTRYVITFPLDNKPNNYGSNREKKATHQAADR